MSTSKSKESYRSGRAHIRDELSRLDSLIRLELRRTRGLHSPAPVNGLAGLYIKDEEIDRVIADKKETHDGRGEMAALIKGVEKIEAQITARVDNTPEAAARLPLRRLARLFQLSPLERDIVLVCLAPELDMKYEKIYAYLQDDVTKKQPTVDLVLRLLCKPGEDRIDSRACFFPQSPLFKYELLRCTDSGEEKPLLGRCLKLDDRIVGFLLDFYPLDGRLISCTRLVDPRLEWSALVLPEDLKSWLQRLAGDFNTSQGEGPLYFYFQGPGGAGRKMAAQAFCRQIRFPLLLVDSGELLTWEGEMERRLMVLFREALLQPAALYFDSFGQFFSDEPKIAAYRNILFRVLEEFSLIIFFSGRDPWPAVYRPGSPRSQVILMEFPLPSFPLRQALWERYLDREKDLPLSADVDIEPLAGRFRLTGGQIRSAVAEAKNRFAAQSRGEQVRLTTADLFLSCRRQSNQKLSEKARKIIPRYGWDDIVLPPDPLQQLREISYYVKHRQKVFYEWGFERKLSLGKGVNILFSGPSGTGKTMAAEVIAHELELDLYKIDLASVVSKYIGETEKNLAAIFQEAETSNAILFFDEADALFGKRSEVKDSHDRYANIEIGYLLQKMEEYTGVVVLATNLRKNLDEAFVRRMHFTVEFPFPEEEFRLRIWKNIFPGETPLDGDIDFDFLTRQFKLSGGNIKNIALAAAFYAADNGGAVTMEHLILASKREFQKMGKVCLKSDFGEYYHLIGESS